MKINSHTVIVGERVVLVPYRTCHVLKYNEWMKSPELLKLTASSPLTLEAEYEMQKSWRDDENKCTFIICDKTRFTNGTWKRSEEVMAMVGDINLFLMDAGSVQDSGVEGEQVAEIDVMIGETSAQSRGMGREAVLAMLEYGRKFLNLQTFIAKIGFANEKSLALFVTKLGFVEISRSEIFEELTARLRLDDEVTRQLKQNTNHLQFTVEEEDSDEDVPADVVG